MKASQYQLGLFCLPASFCHFVRLLSKVSEFCNASASYCRLSLSHLPLETMPPSRLCIQPCQCFMDNQSNSPSTSENSAWSQSLNHDCVFEYATHVPEVPADIVGVFLLLDLIHCLASFSRVAFLATFTDENNSSPIVSTENNCKHSRLASHDTGINNNTLLPLQSTAVTDGSAVSHALYTPRTS